jgi:hypothetical protein
MPTQSKRTRSSAVVSKSSIEQATAFLNELPEKPKQALSLREAVEMMRGLVTDALSKGYSFEEVAEMLTEKGITITPSSLKYYLTRGLKTKATPAKKGRKPGRPPGRKSSAKTAPDTTASISEPVEPAEVEPEPEAPAPAKRRGRPPASESSAAKATARRTSVSAAKAEQPSARRGGRRKKSES